MFEYVYVWDRKIGRCVSVWYVKPQGAADDEAPANTKGPIPETEMDARVKALLLKYPEPRYLVDGGESEEPDGMKAAGLLYETASRDEEE
jgi:hypothetical protein